MAGKGGRPTDYNEEIAEIICNRIVGGESVRAICRDKDMPNAGTVFRWLSKHKEFSEQYAHAKEISAEGLSEECFEIADNSSGDVQRDRLRVDTRKWYLSKVLPKKYGERLHQEITGKDGGPIEYSNMTDDEVEKRLAELQEKLGQ